jgi:RNA polymerase sigma factor (sigma-70 family)
MFSPCARQAVRENFPLALRRKCDSDDVLQEMWQSVFHHVLEHCQPASPEEMIALLRRMARWHTLDLYRRYRRGSGRDVSREVSLEWPSVRRLVEGIASRDLPPDEVVRLHEELAWMVEHAETERDSRIMLMIRDGRTYNEIAARLGVCVRTVRRAFLRMAHKSWRDRGAAGREQDSDGRPGS